MGIDMSDLDKSYWMISYYCVGRRMYGIQVTSLCPADWTIDVGKRFCDGPYLPLYTERINIEQYNEIRKHLV